MNLPVIPQPGSPLASWPKRWLPLAPVAPPAPGSGALIAVSFSGSSGSMILQALSPGNIIRLNQINILTPFSAGTTITLGTVATPGLVLSLVDPAVDAYLSPEFHEVTVPDFLILNASPSGLSGSGRLLYGVQS